MWLHSTHHAAADGVTQQAGDTRRLTGSCVHGEVPVGEREKGDEGGRSSELHCVKEKHRLCECSELAIFLQVKRSGAVQKRVWGRKRRMQLT